jgi:hypothetical protein
MIVTFAPWPDVLVTKENLGKFSFGLLWLQKNTNPIQFSEHGDRPSYVEYHWHGFQLIWGNAYILGGMALLLFLLVIAFRVRNGAAPVAAPPPAAQASAAQASASAVRPASAESLTGHRRPDLQR